jgi:hypothetical protein
LRVVRGHRDGKSPTGIYGTLDRCGLLCRLMAKVELEGVFSEVRMQDPV